MIAQPFRLLLVFISLQVLQSCGGDSGDPPAVLDGSGDSTILQANAGADVSVTEGGIIRLDGRNSGEGASISSLRGPRRTALWFLWVLQAARWLRLGA